MNVKKRNNQFGFTLVEIMVAAGLLGVLSVALVNMISNINRTSKRASQVFNVQQEIQRMSDLLADQDSCFATFDGESFGSTNENAEFNFNTIRRVRENGAIDDIYDVNDELGGADGKVYIESFTATIISENPSPAYAQGNPPINVRKVDARVRVQFRKGRPGSNADAVRNSSVGQVRITRDVKMSFVLNDTNGNVVACYGSSSQYTDAVCDSFGGDIDADGRCVQVELISRSAGTPEAEVALDYAATIGSPTSSEITGRTTTRTPLLITRDFGTNAMRVDEDTIQTAQGTVDKPVLNLNPYGRVEISGTGYDDINGVANGTAALKIMGNGGSYMGFDSNEIQATTTTGTAETISLNPYGPDVHIGRNGGTTHLQVYGNLSVGNPAGGVQTPLRQIILRDGAYINFTSDESLKEEVKELDNVLDKLDSIRGVSFVWKDSIRKDIGYIAQDIEKIYPEVVERDELTGLLNVQYTKMPAVNTAAIKELRAENQELKFRVNLLMKALCEGEDAYKYEDVCTLPLAPLE